MRSFYLDGPILHSADGQLEIDLRAARCQARRASGIGFDFEYICVRPARGRRLDLIAAEGQTLEVLTWLEKARR
ncbi:hypothetical protein [Viridibacterium curvum]|uniref:hypothetical protein n=1 Tax=Viridibacterium curvum TaxID=1101404 RepID=UPI0031ECB303